MKPDAATSPARTPRRLAQHLRDLLPDALAFVTALACAAIAALLVSIGGCGGGVGTEGTGSFASGPVSGYGSIVVNDVHYDIAAGARIDDDDGQASTEAALELGTMVQVRAGAVAVDAAGIARAVATAVRSVRALVGAVSAVDVANAKLTVLGQTVAVSASTVFGDGWSNGPASIPVGQWVVVFGDYDSATGAVLATRIAPSPVLANAVLRVPVTSIDSASRTFSVGSQTYSYAVVADAASLAVGKVVKLTLAAAPDAKGRWVVGNVQPPGDPAPDADDSVDLRGTVAQMTSPTRFIIDNRVIDAANARIDTQLRVGANVRVTGRIQNGTVVASRVEGVAAGGAQRFELLGAIAALDRAAHRFVVRATAVDWVDGLTVFDQGSADDLRLGRMVRVDGVLASDGQSLRATRIRFSN